MWRKRRRDRVSEFIAGDTEKEAFAALKREDGAKALELFKKMAAVGSPVACYCIGDIYLYGQGGVPCNQAESKKWYERAYNSSIPRLQQYAAIKLGYIYSAGYDEANRYGAAIDYDKAFSYFQRLDGSDIANGLIWLGVMYEKGLGTPKDIKKAMALYREAATLGHAVGRKNLASLKVRNGEVVSGYLLWGTAIFEGVFLAIFNPKSSRFALW